MRVIALFLLLVAAVAAAGENRLPREGSGWTGFKPGSWVKLKTTYIPEGRVPAVTLTLMKLLAADENELTLQISTRNALKAQETRKSVLPSRGEAMKGEQAKVEKLEPEPVYACGRLMPCQRTRTSVRGPAGRRVVTDWVASDPRVRVKRTVVHHDPAGKVVQRESMVLSSLDERRRIGIREVRCLAYTTVRRFGEQEQRGTAYVSRDVPGDTVRIDAEAFSKGKRLMTIRVEVLDYEAK
jgi:hypothetical protein